MHFLSDAMAKLEGLLEVNREFSKQRMAENASLAPLPNCAVLPYIGKVESAAPAAFSTCRQTFSVCPEERLGIVLPSYRPNAGRQRAYDY